MGRPLTLQSFQPTPDVMAGEVMQFMPASDAEALKLLRAQYPDAPLSLRVAALAFLMSKKSRSEVARLMPAKI
ncbi:MAG: hypothetical protein AB7T86_18085 [Xanthobacteraceae bacterium]|uniref:hypothetical protein n=1 Tax=Pseudolabrys sp. TaxID=1960880 RepID=UPI003D122C88